MEFEFSNQSGGAIADFDLMINKNSFGVCPDAPCSKHGIKYPEPFETTGVQVLPLKIDKKNADVKSPPKHPFSVQVALKSSLDIFYFTVPCQIHCLISREPNLQMGKDEFKKFWEMIQTDKQFSFEVGGSSAVKLYPGFSSLPGDVTTCLENNGFTTMATTTKQ